MQEPALKLLPSDDEAPSAKLADRWWGQMGQKKSCNTDKGHEVEQEQLSIWIYHVRIFVSAAVPTPWHKSSNFILFLQLVGMLMTMFLFPYPLLFCVRSRLKDWCFGRSSCGGCWKMSLTSNLVSPNVVLLMKNMNMHQWVWQLFHPLQMFSPFKGCMVSSRLFH